VIGRLTPRLERCWRRAAGKPEMEGRTGAREESLLVAVLLSVAGGYLDAFTWIVHDGVLANAQTANVVLLGVYAGQGDWAQGLRHVPPIMAFLAGLFVADRLRRRDRLRQRHQIAMMTLVVEIALLGVVLVIHAGLPDVAGILGISFAAALQTASFTRVEGWTYSSVMTTGNLRQAAEALFAALGPGRDRRALRQAHAFALISAGFATGAALGGLVSSRHPNASLALPIALLGFVLLFCGHGRDETAARAARQ
jgi:uncharacterized membrane protein YoaK (UPF0700 family)